MAPRAHATWSASATARNMACPGALNLTSRIEERRTSEAAAWGTFCHEVGEKCLLSGNDAAHYIGWEQTVDGFDFTFDEEMADCTQAYVDLVFEAATPTSCTLKVEQKFSLASLKPPFDAGGTADAVVYDAKRRNLKVIDLKTGRGVIVRAKGNPQLRTYALGALLANPQWDVQTVTTVIVQPRAAKRDAVEEETLTVEELYGWTVELFEGMLAAAEPDAPLVPGEHCRAYFCPAQATCPALREKALSTAARHFSVIEEEGEQVLRPNSPDSLMPEDIASILDHADLIEDWLNAVRTYGRVQAESGVALPGYQLVEKHGRRRWKDEKAAEIELRDKFELDDVDRFNWKLKTPAQIEKLLGKKRAGEVADLIETPVTGVNLVRSDKTSRPALSPAVLKFFAPLGEE